MKNSSRKKSNNFINNTNTTRKNTNGSSSSFCFSGSSSPFLMPTSSTTVSYRDWNTKVTFTPTYRAFACEVHPEYCDRRKKVSCYTLLWPKQWVIWCKHNSYKYNNIARMLCVFFRQWYPTFNLCLSVQLTYWITSNIYSPDIFYSLV